MALPSSGPMTAAMINSELGRSASAPFSIGGSAERTLAEVPSGSIAFSDFYGKSAALLKTTITIGTTYTRINLSSGNTSGEGFGFSQTYFGDYSGSIANRSVAGRIIYITSYSSSSFNPFGYFGVVGSGRTGGWWQRLIIGNTVTNRLTGGFTISDGWWKGNTLWGHSDLSVNGVRRDIDRRDILGDRRSGTHSYIIE